MLIQQKLFSVLASCLIIGAIIYLVKKGKLKEEYSWLWLLTGIIILTLVLWYDLLLFFFPCNWRRDSDDHSFHLRHYFSDVNLSPFCNKDFRIEQSN